MTNLIEKIKHGYVIVTVGKDILAKTVIKVMLEGYAESVKLLKKKKDCLYKG